MCVCVCVCSVVCVGVCVRVGSVAEVVMLHRYLHIYFTRIGVMPCVHVPDFSSVLTWDLISLVYGYTSTWQPQFTV